MDELLGMLQEGVDTFGARVHAIKDEQWDAPTPCTEWTVADLVDHIVGEHLWVPPLMHGHDLDAAGKIVEGAKQAHGGEGRRDRIAEWDEASRACVDAFGEPDALDRTVSLSRGATPARQYLKEMIFDLVVHSWDLGKAIGYQGELPEDAAKAMHEEFTNMGDLSDTGMFARPVDVADDASAMDKLVAATGRNPA